MGHQGNPILVQLHPALLTNSDERPELSADKFEAFLERDIY